MTGTDRTMDDDGGNAPATLGRVALLIGSLIGALFGCGVIAGIFAGHAERGGGAMSATLIASLAVAAVLAALCGYFAYRGLRAVGASAPRDRRNALTLIVAGALGGVIAVVMLMAGPSPTMFGNDPIPARYAIILALMIGVLLPVISIYWHLRVVDEQEAAAYNKGTLLAMYAFWIGAPVWWLLWRGGLAPAPDGIAICFTTLIVAGIVWLWAKYR
jgi:hypothetical protein